MVEATICTTHTHTHTHTHIKRTTDTTIANCRVSSSISRHGIIYINIDISLTHVRIVRKIISGNVAIAARSIGICPGVSVMWHTHSFLRYSVYLTEKGVYI